MHVDGFRFDLGTILGRDGGAFDQGGGFLDSCRQDPLLSQVKLIAEPWDLGPGGYQVGSFPPGWAEWNDRYRDTVRSFWKGDEGKAEEMASHLAASADLFNKRDRKPYASVNFVTAHEGFTLNDLVSFNNKHNEANREDNRDGNSKITRSQSMSSASRLPPMASRSWSRAGSSKTVAQARTWPHLRQTQVRRSAKVKPDHLPLLAVTSVPSAEKSQHASRR
jgi:pullulanase/glycogen debranching enzyme